MAKEIPQTDLALFEAQTIRKIWHLDRWFFSVIDVIAALTDSARARKYWSDLKSKLIIEGYVEVSEKIGRLNFC